MGRETKGMREVGLEQSDALRTPTWAPPPHSIAMPLLRSLMGCINAETINMALLRSLGKNARE